MSDTSASALDLAKTFFRALEEHDLTVVAPLLAEDVKESIPLSNTGAPEPWVVHEGKEAVMGYLGTIVQNFSQFALLEKDFTVSEDGATVFAEAKGDLIYRETSAPYNNVYVFKFVVRGGLIVHINEYANPIPIAKLLGFPIG